MEVVAIQTQFMRMLEHLRSVRDREEGQGLVEYALILALVSVLLVASLTGLREGIEGVFTTVVENL